MKKQTTTTEKANKYYIHATYCYSSGTFGAPKDGQWFDYEGVGLWDSKEEAQEMADAIYDNTYYLSHGEQGRPELKVRKVRSNQVVGVHVFQNAEEKY